MALSFSSSGTPSPKRMTRPAPLRLSDRPGRVCPKQVLPAERKRQLPRTKPAAADGSFIGAPARAARIGSPPK
jgi:hypothetical protein